MTNNYTTRTASLRATLADIRKLNTKRIDTNQLFIDGKNFLYYINNTISSSIFDERGQNIKDSDIWSNKIDKQSDGNIIINFNSTIEPSLTERWFQNNKDISKNIKKIENNKAYDGNDGNEQIVCNIETNAIVNGDYTFYGAGGGEYYPSLIETVNSDFNSLTSAYEMFASNTALTSFRGSLHNLKDGEKMFTECTSLSDFDSDLYNLQDGTQMFNGCEKLNEFTVKIPNLEDGTQMFYNCTLIKKFDADVSNLKIGDAMFKNTGLNQVTHDFPQLESGKEMFYKTDFQTVDFKMPKLQYANDMFYAAGELEYFSSDLPELIDGTNMFILTSKLKSFIGDLSSLIKGEFMFYNMSNNNIEMEFISDLSSLQTGHQMFLNRPLSLNSLELIANSINDISEFSDWDSSIETAKRGVLTLQFIRDNVDSSLVENCCNEIASKGWTVYLNSKIQDPNTPGLEGVEGITENSSSSSSPSTIYYYKPAEVDEKNAEYTDGKKFYIILGGEYIFGDDISTYGQFVSLEDAIINMGLQKVETNNI